MLLGFYCPVSMLFKKFSLIGVLRQERVISVTEVSLSGLYKSQKGEKGSVITTKRYFVLFCFGFLFFSLTLFSSFRSL